jgi:hypothetical protein
MNTIAKLTLAVVAATTILTSAAQASDSREQGGPGVVISQGQVLSPAQAEQAKGE